MDIKKLLIFDVVVLACYLFVANPAITGFAVHEWISIGLVIVLFVHCATHFDWIVDTILHARNRKGVRLVKIVVDILLVVVFMICSISGIMVSGAVLPTFGLFATGYFFWDPLHAASAKLFLALFLIHIGLSWKMIIATLKRKNGNQEE